MNKEKFPPNLKTSLHPFLQTHPAPLANNQAIPAPTTAIIDL